MIPKCENCLDTGLPQEKVSIYTFGYCHCEAGQSLVFNDKLDKVLEQEPEVVTEPLVELL